MTKQTIEVEGLPEGYRIKSIKLAECLTNVKKTESYGTYIQLEKIQPRKIVLEETGELRNVHQGEWFECAEGSMILWQSPCPGGVRMIWREVKESNE